MHKLWTADGKFDWDGKYFKLHATYGNPQPATLPPILNAAGSGQGRGFASKNANFLFTPAIELARSKAEVVELKAMGDKNGRKVDVMTFSHVVCRPTEAEAKARWQGSWTTPTGRQSTTWCACNSRMRSRSRTICWR